jgi:hypothetical protein
MDAREEDLKKFFQEKFTVSQNRGMPEDFDKIQLKVGIQKFYRFNLNTFNIYYAAAILASLALTFSLGMDYLYSRNKIESELFALRSEIIQQRRGFREQSKASTIRKKIGFSSETLKSATKIPEVKATIKPEKKREQIRIESRPHLERDMADTTSPPKPLENKKRDLKKTVYIIKQDTIVRYDSVKVKRRK